MKYTLLNNWSLMRLVRVVLGIMILIQGFMFKDVIFGIAGVFFTAMALLNAACCAGSSCNTKRINKTAITKEIKYEEVV